MTVAMRKWHPITQKGQWILLFLFERDYRKILMVNDHAQERNKLFIYEGVHVLGRKMDKFAV